MTLLAGVVLAAGMGIRMRSRTNKLLREVLGEPLIYYPVQSLKEAGIEYICLVVPQSLTTSFERKFKDSVSYVVQREARGTWDALWQAVEWIPDEVDHLVVVYGDMILLRGETLRRMMDHHIKTGAALTILTTMESMGRFGMGRVLRNSVGGVQAIVDRPAQLDESNAVHEVAAGAYCLTVPFARTSRSLATLSRRLEYYLTDLVPMASKEGLTVASHFCDDPWEAVDINTRESLSLALPVLRQRLLLEQRALLLDEYRRLAVQQDRQGAGIALERLLNKMFHLYDLEPRAAFQVSGEQIDGAFLMDNETYLVEAKWTRRPVSEDALLVFKGKVEGKSPFTRGAFISIHGFTRNAQRAIAKGKELRFFLIDGNDLEVVLEGYVDFKEMLRHKWRRFVEEGAVLVRFEE